MTKANTTQVTLCCFVTLLWAFTVDPKALSNTVGHCFGSCMKIFS